MGKFEQANGGTLFLDEIGELAIDLQMKLLRVLQEREIERLGGVNTIKVDVRIVTATNRLLEKEVAEGRFRMDLYYRLNVFPLNLPPLRERKGDIPLLVDHFMHMYSTKFNRNVSAISPEAMTALTNYHWPGNIRELEHVVERSVLLASDETIRKEQVFNLFPKDPENFEETSRQIKTIKEIEVDHIMHVLNLCKGKVSGQDGAAALLGIPDSTLVSRMKKLGIKKGFNFN